MLWPEQMSDNLCGWLVHSPESVGWVGPVAAAAGNPGGGGREVTGKPAQLRQELEFSSMILKPLKFQLTSGIQFVTTTDELIVLAPIQTPTKLKRYPTVVRGFKVQFPTCQLLPWGSTDEIARNCSLNKRFTAVGLAGSARWVSWGPGSEHWAVNRKLIRGTARRLNKVVLVILATLWFPRQLLVHSLLGFALYLECGV